MFEELKRLLHHSAIYTAGNFLNRGAAFLLLPLYTHHLSPADYGTLTLFYVTAYVVRALLSIGISHATLRFYFEFDREEERQRVISTCLWASFLFGVLGIALLFPFLEVVSQALFGSAAYVRLFQIILLTLLLEMTMEVMRAFIRAKEYSVLFVVTSLVQLLAQVSFNVYAVVVLQKGVAGILWGNLASVALVWMLLTPMTLRYSGWRFDVAKLRAVLRYSFPLVPGLIFGMVTATSDRFFLTRYSGLSVVGLYGLALNFAVLINVVLIEPFTLAFGPYRFSIMKQANAGEIYSRILTYFVFILAFLCLALSVFAKEVIGIIAPPEYLDTYRIVPILCFGSIVGGVIYIFQTGIYLVKKTEYMFYVGIVTAASVVGFQLMLIPAFDMFGAALAGVLAGALGCLATYIFSQRLYPIPYELNRIFTVVACAVLLYVSSLFVPAGNVVLRVCIKSVLVLSLPFLLGVLRFYQRKEIEGLQPAFQGLGES